MFQTFFEIIRFFYGLMKIWGVGFACDFITKIVYIDSLSGLKSVVKE